MKRKERKQRQALTLLFTCVVICFLVVTLLVVGTAFLLLIQFEVLTGPDNGRPTTLSLMLFFILASFIVGAVVTFFLGKIPLKPVNKLINGMNRLAAGDYRARISYGGPFGRTPAIAELTESFNKMAGELQSTEMLRSDFVNNFSHEFKTPIVSIAGFAKLLKRGSLTEAERAEYLDVIEEESLRLSQMATNVLELTRVENQTILTDVSAYNLSEQLRGCILLLSGKWERKGISFSLDFSEHYVAANEELLRLVWVNLIDNAIKFSPPGGTIEVRIEEGEDTVCVSVLNTGSEIPEASIKKIFNKFYQADESHAAEGNGIGLAIVKRVTELHEGEVSVRSGDGATVFAVELPKRQKISLVT